MHGAPETVMTLLNDQCEALAYAHNMLPEKKGVPQGSSLSPVLMNVFLHQFDMKIQSDFSKNICYARYADDLLIAILRGGDSFSVSQRFQQMFQESLAELKLESTSSELIRGISKPNSTLVLGVLVSIDLDGLLRMRAPINRFKKKIHSFLIQEREKHKKEEGIPSLFKKLLPKIRTYLALYCCCQNEKDVIAYVKNILHTRFTSFRNLRKQQKKQIPKSNFKRILNLLNEYRKKINEKRNKFIEEENKMPYSSMLPRAPPAPFWLGLSIKKKEVRRYIVASGYESVSPLFPHKPLT